MRRALGWFAAGGDERGNALAEFAVASAAMLTTIFGIIDFSRALYTYHLVSNAARIGTRYAIVHGSDCAVTGCPASAADIQTYVRSVSPGIDPNSMTVTTTWATSPDCLSATYQGSGCLVTVQVSYPFRFIVPLIPSATLPMSSTSAMVISQ